MNLLLFPLISLALFFSGSFVFAKLRLPSQSPSESILINLTLGLVLLAQCVTLLGFLELFSPAVFWLILGLFLIPGIVCLSGPAVFSENLSRLSPSLFKRRPLEQVSALALFVLLTLSLIQVLLPNFATDALVYHLAVPKAYLAAGKFVPLPDNVYSFFPLPFEMLYLFGLGLGGETLAQFISWLSLAILAFALYVHCRNGSAPRYAFFASAGFVSIPTVFQYGAATYVDVASALYVFMAWYAWEKWQSCRKNGWFALLCIYSAFAVAIKLTLFIIFPLVFLAIVIANKESESFGKITKQAGLFALTTLILFAPWWAKNFYFAEGNPFAPFLMQYLGGEGGINWDLLRSSLKSQYYQMMGMGTGWLDFLKLPVNLTFFAEPNSTRFDGSIGVLYFLSIPALLGLRSRHLPLLGTLWLLTLFWFYNFQFIRFLIPALALLALLFAQGLQSLSAERPGAKIPYVSQIVLTTVLALGLLYNVLHDLQHWKKIQPLPYLLQNESREEFLSRQIPQYSAYVAVNEKLGKEDKVLLVFMKNYGYLLERPFKSDSFFEAYTLQNMLKKAPSVAGLSRGMRNAGISHILFDARYVFGEYSAFTRNERQILQHFLSEKAEQMYGKNNHYLYHFMLD
jgi:hypothetical protein